MDGKLAGDKTRNIKKCRGGLGRPDRNVRTGY